MNEDNNTIDPQPTSSDLVNPLRVDRSEVEARASALCTQLRRYNGQQMVANIYALAFTNWTKNHHSYEFAYVEYVALIYWCTKQVAWGEDKITQDALDSIYDEIAHVFFEVGLLYHQEAALAQSNADIEELALLPKHAGLMIRGSSYDIHARTILHGLFDAFSAELKDQLGFDASDVLSCFSAVSKVYDLGRIRARKDAEECTTHRDADWFSQHFGDYFLFAPSDISKVTYISEDVAAAILRTFSLEPGQAGEHTLLPSPFSILRTRPVLSVDGGRYFVPNLTLLHAAIQSRLEDLLNPALTADASKRLWSRYVARRGLWVEQQSLSLVERMLPSGHGELGVYYDTDGKQVEVDVVFEVDDLVVIVECKAGAFSPPSLRGATVSMTTEIKDIITAGYQQSIRAANYILAGKLSFTDEARRAERLILSGIPREILRIVVTLAPSDVFATAIPILHRAGLIGEDGAWVLSLADLMIVADCLQLPAELRHYARHRYKAMFDERLLTFDETDYLGAYLATNGLDFFPDENVATISLDFCQALDDYYVFGRGDGPPHQKIAEELRQLLGALHRYNGPLWTQVIVDLLQLGGDARNQIAEAIARLSLLRDGHPRDVTMTLADRNAGITVVLGRDIDPRALRESFIQTITGRPVPVNHRLVIGYDIQTVTASGAYYQGVDGRYFFTPPSLVWQSSIRRN